jgi:predicted ArsR family transcriptional regulator
MTALADLEQQLAQLQPVKGIAPVDVLRLPDSLASVIRKTMRGGMTLSALADELGLSLDQARQVGDAMVEKGYLTCEGAESGGLTYKVYFARMRGHNIAVDL